MDLLLVFRLIRIVHFFNLPPCFYLSGYGMSMTVTSTLGIVRHYFEKRRGAAFASIAVGAGLAGVVNPVILSSMLTKFGYKYTMLYISPMFLLNIVPPALFKEQLPSEKRESSWKLLNSYVKAFRRFVTPFFLLNAFFSYGAQLSVLVLLFTHISDTVDNHTAVISYTIYGLSGLGSSLCLILAFLRFRLNSFILQICFNSLCALGCFMVASLPVAGVTYASCVLLGMSHAGVLAVKGALCIHLYPSEAIEYAYTLSEAIAGIGSFIFPYAAGYLQRAYGSSSGLYLLGTAGLVGCLLLVFSALIRRKLWKMPRTKETYHLSLALLDGIGAVSTLVKLVGQPTLAPNKGSVEKQRNKPKQPDESGELQTQTVFIVADDGYATCSAN